MTMSRPAPESSGSDRPRGFTALANDLANAAVHAGVADEVVRLLADRQRVEGDEARTAAPRSPRSPTPPSAPTRSTLLSVEEACQALGVRQADARRWLVSQGLVREVLGRRKVLWGDVLDRLGAPDHKNPQPAGPHRRPKKPPMAEL
jgi:hypothetical protein